MKRRIFVLAAVFLMLHKTEGTSEAKSSLVFAIDSTGSMDDDIREVMDTTDKIFDTVVKSNASHIEDFILVTFADPDVRFRVNTKDRSDFKKALKSIDVDGGGDCPEFSLSGIQLAVERSRHASNIYVFTDASAKDIDKYSEVEALCQKKQSQVVFLLTGACEKRKSADEGYQVYQKLAKATSGQVFHLMKSEVGKILNYVRKTIESRKNVIVSKTFPPGHGKFFEVPVDSYTKELVIAVSGLRPTVSVTDSGGAAVPTDYITKLKEVAVVKIENLKPDVYKVEVGSKSDTHVTVSGTTSVHFQHGFSVASPRSITDTATRPVPGEKSYLSIKLSTDGNDIELQNVQILDMDDKVVLEKPLKLLNKKDGFYTTEPITTPNHMFRIAIRGYEPKSDTYLTRISLTPIKPQDVAVTVGSKPEAPVVTVDEDEINAEYDEPLQLRCKIRGYPKPDIIWEPDTSTGETSQKDSTIELPADFISILEIKKVNKNVIYTCKASNSLGSDSKTIAVKTKRKTYFNVVELPKDLKIKYAKAGQTHCKVDAVPPATITWYKNSRPLVTNKNLQLSPDNSILYIRSMTPDLEDKYMCEARNKLDNKKAYFYVSITGVEKPAIDTKTKLITALRHSNADIRCKVTKGIPKPTITWSYRKMESYNFTKRRESSETIHLKNVDLKEAGTFRCEVKNYLGPAYHEITLAVEYAPIQAKRVVTSELKNDGETVTLECPFQGIPTPQIAWKFNGKEMPKLGYKYLRDGRIWFTADLRKIGEYECKASNKHGVSQLKIKVDVVDPTSIDPPSNGTVEAMVGGSVDLFCHATGYPQPQLSWIFYSKDPKIESKTFKPSMSTGKLNLVGIQQNEEGFYTCVATNKGGSKNITYEVTVFAPPFIKYSKKEFKAVLQDLVLRVPCEASGNPKPEIEWSQEGRVIAMGTEWNGIEEDGTLLIKNVDERSAGSYSCRAKNKFSENSESFNVTVKSCPESGRPTNTIRLVEGSATPVSCSVPHEKTDRLLWFKDCRNIARGELEFTSVTPSDSGIYTCRVSSFTGAKTGTTVEIVVGSKPRFKHVDEDDDLIEFVEGGMAVMDCMIHGDTVPEVTWLHDGKLIDYKGVEYAPIMDSPSVMGNYTCIVKNEFGTARRDFVVKTMECRLDIRTDFNDVNAPLMLTINMELPKFQVTDGQIIIPREKGIILYCPSTSFDMRGYKRNKIQVTCEDDKMFNYEGTARSFTYFKCNNKIKATLRTTKQPCSTENSELNDVGYFTNDRRSFIKVYQLCLDENKETLYSKVNLQPTLAHVLSNYGFSDFKNKYLTTLFDCNYQNNELSGILDFDFHKTDGCCFAKRQFVSPKDVAPGVPQRATFTLNNVVPQWSTCNSQNWDDVEERIRGLVVAANRELQVWTGAAQALQMFDAYYILRDITIPIRTANQSVPLFLWKVVQDPERKASLAIIQVNVPDLTQERAPSYVRCRDVCDSVDWMRNRRWLEVDRGYTYCCELSDFERTFRYIDIFPRRYRLLKDVY